jgi:hypothetical protein
MSCWLRQVLITTVGLALPHGRLLILAIVVKELEEINDDFSETDL